MAVIAGFVGALARQGSVVVKGRAKQSACLNNAYAADSASIQRPMRGIVGDAVSRARRGNAAQTESA